MAIIFQGVVQEEVYIREDEKAFICPCLFQRECTGEHHLLIGLILCVGPFIDEEGVADNLTVQTTHQFKKCVSETKGVVLV